MRMDEARLDFHLSNWAEWQRDRPSDFGRSYPFCASGGIRSDASRDFDSMVAEADAKCARATDAVVDGLPPIERASVYHVHLETAFRYPDIGRSVERAYSLARVAIKTGLKRRGIV